MGLGVILLDRRLSVHAGPVVVSLSRRRDTTPSPIPRSLRVQCTCRRRPGRRRGRSARTQVGGCLVSVQRRGWRRYEAHLLVHLRQRRRHGRRRRHLVGPRLATSWIHGGCCMQEWRYRELCVKRRGKEARRGSTFCAARRPRS